MQTVPESAPTTEPALNQPAASPEPADNHSSPVALAEAAQLSILSPLAEPQLPAINHSSSTALVEQSQLAATVIEAKPLSVPATTAGSHKARRKGRIACLPKLQRDMVGRMLLNGVPYKNIVAALDDSGFNVTERNISTWATGGYLEWRFEQDLVLQSRLDQDHLVDHVRRDNAAELPEAGLQAAATRLSQILIEKTARAEDVEAHIGSFSQMVDLLSRLTREIAALQKQRDDSRRSLGRAHDPARIQDDEEMSANEAERFYSDPPADSSLAKPEVPPLLPPEPTSSLLAEYDREEAHKKELQRMKSFENTLRTLGGANAATTPASGRPAAKPAALPALPQLPQLPDPSR